MHLRQPIVPPKERPLAVLIHARFSTEEQRQSSIDDQITACRAFLTSGLYRHHTKAGELFESAVDAGVRVICPSDYIDTADDDWPDRLNMCQMQHARSNFYTRQRIERAHDGLWARGAAVGQGRGGRGSPGVAAGCGWR